MACKGCGKSRGTPGEHMTDPKSSMSMLERFVGSAHALIDAGATEEQLPRIFAALAQARRFAIGDRVLQEAITKAMTAVRNKVVPDITEIMRLVRVKADGLSLTPPPAAAGVLSVVEQHVGSAAMLLGGEVDHSTRLKVVGHLFYAENNSISWPNLFKEVAKLRKDYQQNGQLPDFENVEHLFGEIKETV